jgi:glucokinase
MAQAFLPTAGLAIDAACFGVAGPVIDGAVKATNLPWLVEAKELAVLLGLKSVHLLNDLEAAAYAVPLLQPAELRTLAAGKPARDGNLALIAPGTGLGEAFLTRNGAGWDAHASEGGHSDFAPADDKQIELLRYLQPRFGHVSFERVCSGIGVPNIYDFLRDSGHASETPDVARQIAESADRTRTILQIAVESPGSSQLCAATLEMFSSVLGAEAGNLTLKVMATGGLYIGGGIPAHILPSLETGPFLSSFRDKGRFSEMMSRVPVHVIVAQAGLIGAAAHGLSRMRAATK